MSHQLKSVLPRRLGWILLLWTVGVGGVVGSGQGVSAQTPITGSVVTCEEGQAAQYPCENVDLLSYLPIDAVGGGSGVGLNDVWGWTDPQTGTEYALVGRTDGIAFVDVSTPTEPTYVGQLPTRNVQSLWRDVKVYANHAFVVSEGRGHGMQIFDLTQLRGVTADEQPVTFEASAHYDGVERAHNVVINRDTGFAYIVGGGGDGTTCGGGLHMVDIHDPTAPTFVGCFADPSTGRSGTGYTHDAQCVTYQGPDGDYQGDEVCFNANETALNIANVTDKDDPSTIANATYPMVGYVHQAWLTEDHRYLYVDDEFDEQSYAGITRTRTLVFDVADLDNPELATSYLGTTGATDHNQYIDGRYAYQANYQSGLRILDVASPEDPAEVAFFDTYPSANNPAFNGAWSTYPFFERNFVLISSIGEGLFVVRPALSSPIRSVTGTRQGQSVHLEWRISAEAQTDRIEVERKTPAAAEWMLEETLMGRTGGSIQQYEYTIEDLPPGTHQFRIRHVSVDSTTETSGPVSVRVLPTDAYVATGPFPNPARTHAQFTLTLREEQDVRVALYDALGRRVTVLHDGTIQNGVVHRFRIQTRDRASGTYFLRVQGTSFRLLRRLTVVR